MPGRFPRRLAHFSPLVLLAVLLAGCGGGTLGIASGFGGGGGGSINAAPVVSDVQLLSFKTSPAQISFRVTDAESDAVDVQIAFAEPGSSSFVDVLLTGANTNLSGLPASPDGVTYVRLWDFASQVTSGSGFSSGITLNVRLNGGTGTGVAMGDLQLGNDPPVILDVIEPGVDPITGEVKGNPDIGFMVSDSSKDVVTVRMEYDFIDDGQDVWFSAASLGPAPVLMAQTTGSADVFFWKIIGTPELQSADFKVRVRIIANDGLVDGTPLQSQVFRVDNNGEPFAAVNSAAFVLDPDRRRGLPIPFFVQDPEGDPVQVVFQYRRVNEPFPSLPFDPNELAAILADPALRAQSQIATELPLQYVGTPIPVDSTSARLPELGGGAAGLTLGGLPGRELEILRASAVPALLSSSWSANTLVEPVAALPIGDGLSAYVLDRINPGQWRLIEVELSSGAVVDEVATGSGDPSTLALDSTTQALVGVDTSGVWSLLRVTLEGGTVETLVTADGTTDLGPIRGLARQSSGSALITVGTQLVQLFYQTQPARQLALPFPPINDPRGIALHPTNPNLVYLCARLEIDPQTGLPSGRVLEIDLTRRDARSVGGSAVSFPRPEALAFERDGRRLMIVVDLDDTDGLLDLAGLDLGEGGATPFPIALGLPAPIGSLASGADDLRLLTFPALADLAAGGGLEQRQSIVDFSPLDQSVTTKSPFAPPLDSGKVWRVADRVDDASGIPFGAFDVFVWDSSDLADAGQVILRAVPYDSEQGFQSDTGVPRTITAAIDVEPLELSDNKQPFALVAADMDEDGDLDIVSTFSSTSEIGIHLQDGRGHFASSADVTIATDPGGPGFGSFQPPLAVGDLDHDGDLDIAAAEVFQNRVQVYFQGQGLAFNDGGDIVITGPSASALEVADLDGNGSADLLLADSQARGIAVYLQGSVGLSTAPDFVLGDDQTTPFPNDVEVADIDADGLLDVVACSQTSELILVFRQLQGGGFSTAPDDMLGGPAETSDVRSLAIGDIDEDGDQDILSGNLFPGSISLFLQDSSGAYTSVPSIQLEDSGAVTSPVSVALADADGDGLLDIVAANQFTDSVSIFLQASGPSFDAMEAMIVGNTSTTGSPQNLLALDIDADGDVDIITANGGFSTGNDVIAVFLHQSGGDFDDEADVQVGSSQTTPFPQRLAVGDLDSDGDLDLVSANFFNGTITIFPQTSPGVFSGTPFVLGSPPQTPSMREVDVVDLDGDGDLDIVGASQGSTATPTGNPGDPLVPGSLFVFFQTTTQPSVFDTGDPQIPDIRISPDDAFFPRSIEVADLDGDTDSDIAVADSGAILLYFQTPEHTFSTTEPDLALFDPENPISPQEIAAADLDQDGDTDLASLDFNTLSIYFQSASGFSPLPDVVIGGPQMSSLDSFEAADLDGDGAIDLFFLQSSFPSSFGILYQESPGVFALDGPFPIDIGGLFFLTAPRAADIDADGDLDLLLADPDGDRILVIPQLGRRQLSSAQARFIAGGANGVRDYVAVDVDGDGDIDVATANSQGSSLSVFFASH